MFFNYVNILFFIFLLKNVLGKIHFLSLTNDLRRNILLSKFGYNTNGTFDFNLFNFTVPEAVLPKNDKKDKFGFIGFTLSKNSIIAKGIQLNPYVCQLQQNDQGIDALFFVFDFPKKQLLVTRSGNLKDIQLCPNSTACINDSDETTNSNTPKKRSNRGILSKIIGGSTNDDQIAYENVVPLTIKNGQYNTNFGIRFNSSQNGFYYFLYHNCFNYRENGYSSRVAVDFAVSIIEQNTDSFLSAGDIYKPTLYIVMSFLFSLIAVLWINLLCKSDRKNIFCVHKLMTFLVILKVLSLFFHGINYLFVSKYGHQKEIWAITYYVVHLLKGALLFGTIILIGTGYTFFKNFLSDKDRNLILTVLPLQVIDNVAMVIIEESEFGDQRYYFWFEIFVFLDILCCIAIILPIIWSMQHLKEGARSDGKAAFNLEKLKLFKQFYIIVILYIYLTRITKFIVEYLLPFNYQWISETLVEITTILFFFLIGSKFRPLRGNPYLKISQVDESDAESAIALTNNGLYENISRVQRISVQDELNSMPDSIEDENDKDDTTLLPKFKQNSALSVL